MKRDRTRIALAFFASKRGIALSALAALVIAGVAFPILRERGVGSSQASILFVGDLMFDRTIRSIAEKKGYDHLFSCVQGYLEGFDLVVGNLEGPITGYPSVSKGTKPGEANNTTFTFDREIARSLSQNGIGAVSLGNNHIWDFGRPGALETERALEAEGVLAFGSPAGATAASTTIDGVRISIVSFNQFLGENDPERTVLAIWRARKESDFVAVYAHWGDEYRMATDYQRALAHRFVEAGADLVVGSHPHIVQEHEIYKGKHVFYSLGNFIFDQYWTPEVRTGGGAEVALRGGETAVSLRTFDIGRDGRTCLK